MTHASAEQWYVLCDPAHHASPWHTADHHRCVPGALQVWNMNRYGGMVGVFHLQGASWDRRRRRFHMHHKHPPKVKALVKPSDVEPFNLPLALDAAGPKPQYAVYVNSSDHLCVLHADASVQVRPPAPS
jgi:hypothetical protein